MKLKITFFAALTSCIVSFSCAQNVGIGTNSPGAKLDISSSNSGVLIPRVSLTSTTVASPVTSPAVSTMVYNIATAGSGATAVSPGFYYWNGAAWIRVIDNASLTGATSVSNTSSGNNLSTTVNSVTGSTVPIINSHLLSLSANTLTSTINGVAATSNAVSGVSNTSSANTLSTTVNGVTGGSVNIINTNTSAWTQATGLTNTVNGQVATIAPASGTVANVMGYNSAGAPVYQAITGTAHGVLNTISGNTISTTVDGTTGSAVTVPNIYTADGSLTGNRTVTMAGNNLTFSSTTGNLIFNPSSTGFMGIATASPAAKLHIAGGGAQDLIVGNTGSSQQILIGNGSGYSSVQAILQGSAYNTLALNAIGGSVGIGTTSPSALLELKKGTQVQANLVLSGQEYYQSGNAATGIALMAGVNRTTNKQLWITDQDYIASPNATNAVLRICTSTASIGYIDAMATNGITPLNLEFQGNGGNVGIGTATPTFKLDVQGATATARIGNAQIGAWPATTSYAYFGNDALSQSAGGNYALLQATDGTTYVNRSSGKSLNFREGNADQMNIISGGNVGIGTTTPAVSLDVNGTVNNKNPGCVIQATGWTTGASGTSYSTSTYFQASTYTSSGTWNGEMRLINQGGAFNTSTGIFTAPQPGFYMVSLRITGVSETNRLLITASLNGASPNEIYDIGPYNPNCTGCEDLSFTTLIYMNANDTHRILRHVASQTMGTILISYVKL